MKKLIASAILVLAVAGVSLATNASRATNASGTVCTKTGAPIDSCCCIEKDGALVCALTGEPVSSCCCEAQ